MKLVAAERVEDHYLTCTSRTFALAKGQRSEKVPKNTIQMMPFVSHDFYHGT